MQKSQETPEQSDKTHLLAEVPSEGAEHHFQKMGFPRCHFRGGTVGIGPARAGGVLVAADLEPALARVIPLGNPL